MHLLVKFVILNVNKSLFNISDTKLKDANGFQRRDKTQICLFEKTKQKNVTLFIQTLVKHKILLFFGNHQVLYF